MTTKVNNPLLDMESEPITGIVMDGSGNGIDMGGSPLKNIPAPVDVNDAARFTDVTATAVPVGVGPIPWAGTEGNVPTGWLLCDGTIYNIATYPDLHAVIQNTYGGDNVTTFAVPDMRGNVPVGKDNMGGSAAGNIPSATPEGATGGADTHTLVLAELPSHIHTGTTADAGSHTHTGTTDADGVHDHPNGVATYDGNQGSGGVNAARDQGTVGSAGSHTHTITVDMVADHNHTFSTSSEGSDTAHNNVQPYLVTNYIIKAEV